jgi:glutamyl-tRNA synthetase
MSRRGVLPAQPTDEQRAVVRAATPLVNERMQVLSEAEGMLGFLLVDERDFHVDVDDAGRVLTKEAVPTLGAALGALEELEPWATADIEGALRAALVEGLGLKPKVAFGPVRVAATGRRVSPPLFESLELLGRDRSLDRLRGGLAIADE